MKLILLSKENILLAKAEAETLLGTGKLLENILLIDTKKTTNRLAYSKLICKVLFEANKKNIKIKTKKFSWNKLIKGSFALQAIINGEISQTLSKTYGGIIYDTLKNPKVDLDNPSTKIIIISNKNKFFICKEEWTNKEKFDDRRPDFWPAHAPITLGAKLSRACVNLTGTSKEIYDPFCGIGGILIEAGLMKLNVIGSDLNQKMLDDAKRNLEFYKIKNYKIFKQDATKIKKKYNYIATDPPYGKSSKKIGDNLYAEFIKNLEKILKKRAVIIFPSYFDANKLLKKSKLKVIGKYSAYVHKSLTRNIFVLQN